MKRVIALLLCLVLTVGVFAACDNAGTGDTTTPSGTTDGNNTPNNTTGSVTPQPIPGENGHLHTYSDTLTSDAEGHWYEPTCECEDAPIAKLAHTDANNDGACDICTYTNHEHTYAEDWTIDCTNHWHAADCGHIVAGVDVEAHADANNDGKCDVCTYIIEDIHKHYYASEWSKDASYHWHAALCEHGVEVADKAAHNLDAAGFCTVCEAKVTEINMADIAAVLAAAAARNYKVTSGNVAYENTIPDINITQTHSVYYVLGNGYAYVNRFQYDTATQAWYQLIGEDQVFGVITYDSGVTIEPVAVGLAELNGYSYNPSTIVSDISTLDGVLSALYALTAADTAKNVVTNYNAETGVYSFSFEYLAVNKIEGNESLEDSGNDESTAAGITTVETRLFTVTAEFVIDENFVITEAEFEVGAYNQDIDNDYTYDVATGTYTMNAGALADTYNYKVAQTSGDRNYISAYPKEALIPNDFDFEYEGNVVTDKLVVSNGDAVSLSFVNLKPFSARVNFIDPEQFNISIKNAAGEDAGFYSYFSTFSQTLNFTPNAEGEYTVTITYGDIVKTFDLTVNAAAPTSVTVHPIVENSGWGDTWLEASEYNTTASVTLAVGETFDFAVRVNPAAAAQGFTYTIDSENATISDVTINNAIIFYENLETYVAKQFVSNTDGIYVVTFASTVDPSVTGTLTVIVGNGGQGGDEGGDVTQSFDFVTPGNFAKTEVQTFVATKAGTYTITAEGLAASTWLQYYQASDDTWPQIQKNLPFSIELGVGDQLQLRLYGWSADDAGTAVKVTVTLSSGGNEGGDDPVIPGLEGSGTDADPYKIPAAGDYTCAFAGGWNNVWYAYTVPSNGYVTLSTTFANGWLEIGADIYSTTNNMNMYGTLDSSIKVYALAGTTLYIGISENTGVAATIPFTVSFEAFESQSFEHIVGTWTGLETTPWGTTTYTLTVNADGTGKVVENYGYGESVYTISFILVDGINVTISYTGDWGNGKLVCTYENGVFTCVQSPSYTTFVFTQGTPAPEEPAETPLEIGNNAINAADVVFVYTATEAGTLNLAAGAALMGPVEFKYSVNGGDAVILALSSNVDIVLAAGDKVVITVTAEGYSSITATWIGTSTPDPDPDPTPDPDPIPTPEGAVAIETLNGTGTKADPFIVTGAGVYKMTSVNGYPGQFITLTATENVTFTVLADVAEIWAASFSTEYANAGVVATFTLAAGETKALTVATESGTADVVYLTITCTQEGGNEGEDTPTQDISGTYLGTDYFGNQMLTVVIDSKASTVVFTYNHPMMGTSTVNCTYAIVDGAMVLYGENGAVLNPLSGSVTLTNGIPTNASYNGNDYTLATEGGSAAEPNGTEASPYQITVPGDYTCAFPGGYTPVWYTFTAAENGTVTVSTAFATPWLLGGSSIMYPEQNNSGEGNSISFAVVAGTTYYIGVGNWAETAIDVPFTVSLATATPDPEPETPGINAVEPVVGNNYAVVMFQGNANKIVYLCGGMSSTYYFATSENKEDSLTVSLVATEGGYYLLAGDGTYINMVVSGTYVNGAYEAAPSTVYTYDATLKTLKATVNGEEYIFGTRNDKTYTTIGPVKVSADPFYCQFELAEKTEGGNTDTPVVPEPTPDPEPEVPATSATISFADKANRTTFTTETQVWEQNGITVTNNKAKSISPVADYANPARFYKNSEVTVEYKGMKKIVVEANNANYATSLVKSIGTPAGVTVTVDGTTVTIELAVAMDSITIALTDGQVRVNSITVS